MKINDSGPIMRIAKGERIYKIFVFKPVAGRQWNYEYRILTKEKKDGNLEMVAYSYKEIGGKKIKSGITRAPDVPKDKLAGIIQGIMRRTGTQPDEFYERNLSGLKDIDEQIKHLQNKPDLFDLDWLH